jgi:predicted RNA-binding Zn-ribbon protein involved in translation (DUF1610 family)
MNLTLIGDKHQGFSAHGQSDGEEEDILLPCPFCGSITVTCINTHSPHYNVICEDCGAEGPDSGSVRRQSRVRGGVIRQHRNAFYRAIKNWNKRSS